MIDGLKLIHCFNFLTSQDDKEELGAEYDIDGAYAPRLYFFGMRMLISNLYRLDKPIIFHL